MEKVRNPNIDKAKEMYKQGNKLIDIANILEVAEGTIRSWKNRYNWDDSKKKNATLQKKERNATINKKVAKELIGNVTIEAKEVMKNDELNEKQKLFCIYYSKSFNATKSYIKAYGCEYWTGAINGHKLLKTAKIKKQIEELTELTISKASLTQALIQKYIDIALADMKDYTTFGNEEIEGEYGTYTRSFVNIKDSSEVDGTLITEISQGKDGIKIKFADKMKAMDFLNKHCNLLNDEEKTKLDIENIRLRNKSLQADIDKKTGDNLEIEDTTELESEIYGNN